MLGRAKGPPRTPDASSPCLSGGLPAAASQRPAGESLPEVSRGQSPRTWPRGSELLPVSNIQGQHVVIMDVVMLVDHVQICFLAV